MALDSIAESPEPFASFYLPRLAADEEGLERLSLAGRNVDDPCLQRFVAALASNTQVHTLNLSNNHLTDASATVLAQHLERSVTLTSLTLDGNRITDVGGTELLHALESNHTLTELSIKCDEVGAEVQEQVAEACLTNQQPMAVKRGLVGMRRERTTTLDLTGPVETPPIFQRLGMRVDFTLSTTRIVCAALRANTTLTTLNLSQCNRGDDATELLASAIASHPTLLEVSLDSNLITDRGAVALAGALRENTALSELSLCDNEIGDAGAKAFVELGKVNTTLSHLAISNNNVTPAVQSQVVHALLLNSQPAKLREMHEKLLLSNSTVKVVALDDYEPDETRRVTDVSCRVLCNCLQHNISVHTLNLNNNYISDEGAKLLSVLLKSNSTLRKLKLRDNRITEAGLRYFIEATAFNNTIEVIDLADQSPPIAPAALEELRVHVALNLEPIAFKKLVPLLLANDISVKSADLTQYDGVRHPCESTCSLLLSALRDNTNVTSIDLSGNTQIGMNGVTAVLDWLREPCCVTPVTTLKLARMNLRNDFVPLLAKLLVTNTTLRCLDLSENDFTVLEPWTTTLRKFNNTLTSIDLTGSTDNVDPADLHELKSMLQLNSQPTSFKATVLRVYDNDPSLTVINLVDFASQGPGTTSYRYRRQFDDTSVILLSEALQYNTFVEKVDLSCNRIGNPGAQALAEMLKVNRTVTTLNLANNAITDEGFMAIAEALLTNPTLSSLVVDDNPIKNVATRKQLNMATSHNAMVGRPVYAMPYDPHVDSDQVTKEIDDAILADGLREYRRTVNVKSMIETYKMDPVSAVPDID